MKKLFAAEQRKQDKNQKSLVSRASIHTHSNGTCSWICGFLQEEAARNREQNLEDAKSIVISEDASLPPAKKVLVCSWLSLISFVDLYLFLLCVCTYARSRFVMAVVVAVRG